MTPALLAWWIVILVAGMALSFLCSGLEMGSYSLNRVRLHLLAHRHHHGASILHDMLKAPERVLASLLIGNNIANYMTSAALTVMLGQLELGDLQLIAFNVLIITPTMFIFCETLPKDLFAAYSDRMMYPLARFLHGMSALFTWTGLLPLITSVNGLAQRLTGAGSRASAFHPRMQISTLVKEGLGHGLLSDEQSAIVERVLDLGERTVDDEMVPWSEVVKLRETDDAAAIWKIADQTAYTRVPVVTATGKVAGVVNILEALTYEKQDCPPIAQLLQPTISIREHVPVRTALKQLQAQRLAMAIVTDQDDFPVGVVTAKDLVEPITGELASW